MREALPIGSLVAVRGQQWLLTRAQRFEHCTIVSLEGRDRDNVLDRLQLIEPFDRASAVSTTRLKRRHRRAVLTHALSAIHGARPPLGLWTAANARIELHAYQLEPALAVLSGATRLLLADAVGLGKTIQAGLLLSELHQRGWIARALIVCPAGLRSAWQRELGERFGLTASIIDQQSIADRVAAFPPGINPWLADSIVIASIDFIKRDEVLAALAGVPIDLLIADEAHHLCPGTDRGAAIAQLAGRSPWCVFLTATPHSGDRDAFAFLTSLGRHGDEIVVFRRHRRDVGLAHARRTRFLEVHPHPAERALFDAIDRYSRAIWFGRGQADRAARLLAITIARRACSSLAAITRTLRRRLDLLGTEPVEADQPRLPWEDVDDADGDDAPAIVAVQGLDNLVEERSALEQLIALAAACGSSSKLRRLTRLLSRIKEPVIVFTEYRDTLTAIVDRLKRSHRVTSIHGAMPLDQRGAAVDAFNGGQFDVLVATDAAGEGLNLHHRCRFVVDVELPWNPLRLEQRVGRVDRIGQPRVVHAMHLFHGRTIEQDVLERLSMKQRRADHDLDLVVSEREIAAAVFAGDTVIGADVPRLDTARVDSAKREIDRIRRQRRVADLGRVGTDCWEMPRRASQRSLTVLFREVLTNAHGVVSGTRLEAVAWHPTHQPPSPREWRAAIRCAADRSTRRRWRIREWRGLARRINAIRKHLNRQQRREYQRSLFDGRADALQTAREHDAARLDQALTRIARTTAPPVPPRTSREVVAAWPEPRT